MKSILLLTLLFILGACPVNETQQKSYNIHKRDIAGIWSVIRNDSVYEEAIITDNNIWGLDTNGNEFVFRYDIRGDTITIAHPKKLFSLRYKRIDTKSFILENQQVKSKYHQLEIFVDTTNLKKGDAVVIDEFAAGFYARKQIWLARGRDSDK